MRLTQVGRRQSASGKGTTDKTIAVGACGIEETTPSSTEADKGGKAL